MTSDILWTSGFFNERFPAPLSPLGWSLIGPLIEELALREPLRFLGYPDAETIPLTRLWRGHPYANVLAFQIFYKCFPDFILPEDADRYFPDGATSLRKRAPYPRWIDAPRFGLSLLRAFFSDPLNVSPLNNYRYWARYTREHDARVDALRADFDELAHADPREIFAALKQAEKIHRAFLRIHRWSLIDADFTFGWLTRLVGGDAERAASLIANVPSKTMQVDTDLRQLSLDEFLARHGHRSFSLDIAVSSFAESPEQVMRLMQASDDGGRQTMQSIPISVSGHASGIHGAIFNWILNLARHYVALREDQRYYWQKSLAVSRHLYLLLADRLVKDAVIENRNAVFYATHHELVDYFDRRLHKAELAQSILVRQMEWREYHREFAQAPTESYPLFLRGDASLQNVGATLVVAQPYQWRGRAISPGIARGPARIVQSADELARVQPGDILVAPATDPAWTPVFAQIAGLVVERGGILSHSAVVAREYHLPAVAGIPHIVAEIKEGDTIEVDGNSGIVVRVQG